MQKTSPHSLAALRVLSWLLSLFLLLGAICQPSLAAIAVGPTISLSTSGSTLVAPGTVVLTATASTGSLTATITEVQFYSGGALIGTVTQAPYTFTLTKVAAGGYQYTAKVTTSTGQSTTSSAVTISVANPPTPVLSLSTTGSTLTAPGTVLMSVTDTASSNNIAQMQFFSGSTLLGTVTQAPWNWTWNNVAAGNYNLVAKATTLTGVIVQSNTPTIVVTAPAPPTISLSTSGSTLVAPGTVILTATAATTTGTITQVQFYSGGSLIGTVTQAPYTLTLSKVAAGSYQYTAKATASTGQSATSSAVTISVANPPTPVLSLSTAGSTLTAPGTVLMSVTDTASSNNIAQMQFYNGSTLLGTVTQAPWNYTWSNVAAGSYNVYAKATTLNGAVVQSNIPTITVSSAKLTTSLSTSAASLVAPGTLTLTATTTDTGGTVTQVQFYNGSTLLGTVTSAPYTLSWTKIAAGSYSLTAKATDSTGLTATSAAVPLTVTSPSPPTVSLTTSASTLIAPGTLTLTAATSDANGTITQVQFYNGSTLLGTATSAPYTYAWSNIAAGSYSLTAVATDSNNLSTTSTAVPLTVTAHTAPVITLAAAGTSLVTPATVQLTATVATSNNATVSQVSFYDGSNFVGSTSQSPYSLSLPNVAVGSHRYTAQVTDSLGASTTSAAVVVTVTAQAAPQVYYIDSDHLHTPRLITDANGNVVWQWDGEPFGSTPPNSNPAGQGTFTFNLRYPGQYYDQETNLHYNYFRDYDPSTGRYLEADPLGDLSYRNNSGASGFLDALSSVSKDVDAGMSNSPVLNHLFGYVDQNPLIRSDSMGLDYGTQSCQYYNQQCQKNGGSYYCTIGPLVCGNTPDSSWTRCVRKCLQETDKLYCHEDENKNSCPAKKNGSDLLCVVNIHQMCWEECAEYSHGQPPSAQPF